MKKFLVTIGLLFTLLSVTTPAAFAKLDLPDDLHPDFAPVIKIVNGNEADYGNYFLQLIAGGLLYFAAPVAVLVIAIAGLRYVTAHGKQENLEGAKKTLMWAIIGLLVIIMSFAMVRLVITTILQTAPTPAQTTPATTNAPTNNAGAATAGGK